MADFSTMCRAMCHRRRRREALEAIDTHAQMTRREAAIRHYLSGVKPHRCSGSARPSRLSRPCHRSIKMSWVAFGLGRVGADIADPQAREHPPQVRGGLLPCQLFLQLQC